MIYFRNYFFYINSISLIINSANAKEEVKAGLTALTI